MKKLRYLTALNRSLFFLGLVVIAAGLVATYFVFGQLSNGLRTHLVMISEQGFLPARLTVVAGDTITFTNSGKVSVWPASDPHPTHEYLAGFDPRKAITPGNSWSYTFIEAGTWRDHDHLNPISQGVINVLGKNPDTLASANGQCDGQCFDTLIRKTVQEKGIDAAYALFQDTYEEGQLPRSCHWTAHQIGQAAYELFKGEKDFPISLATTYCGYGFYHGFLESLLRENPDPAYALQFCEKVKEKLGAMGLQNCYHGIGHGYTEDPPPPETVGKFNAMIGPGIKMCEFLFGGNFTNLNLCLTGVFTVPAGFAANGKYGLSIDAKNPFKYCKDQPYRYLKACYGEFAPKLDAILQWDLRGLPHYVDGINDPKLKRLVTWVVPSVMMAHDILSEDHRSYIVNCRESFSGQLRRICWGGAILGFFMHGEPGKQYEKVISFCNSSAWQNDDERAFCWGEGFRQMRTNYSLDFITRECPRIPVQFRSLCLDSEHTHMSPYDDPSFN